MPSEGLEPPTQGLGRPSSIHLSYEGRAICYYITKLEECAILESILYGDLRSTCPP